MPIDKLILNQFLMATDEPVVLLDSQNLILFANTPFRHAFSLPDGELAQLPLIFFIQAQNLDNYLKNLQQTPQEKPYFELHNEHNQFYEIKATNLGDLGQLLLFHEITRFKERDRIKSDFVSIVSHDLRSPLTAILGYVELVQRSGELNPQQDKFISRIERNVKNIASMITDLLDLGRLEAGYDLNLVDCYIEDIIADIIESIQPNIQQKKIKLQLNLDHTNAPIDGDIKHLRQAFSNLINNAVKYTPESGTVVISSELQNGQAIIHVKDTGIGISASDQARIFDKYYRAQNVKSNYEGTGLGLSIVKSIIDRHNGRIWVHSNIGSGTTFTIVLPLADRLE